MEDAIFNSVEYHKEQHLRTLWRKACFNYENGQPNGHFQPYTLWRAKYMEEHND